MWTKKSRKGKHEWEKACIESKKTTLEIETHVKTRFVSKVIMFEETLKFKQVMLCYGRQKTLNLHRVLKAQVWGIVEAIITYLYPLMGACIMNQFKGHWLLFDSFNNIINLIMELEFESNPLVDGDEAFDLSFTF